MVGETERGRGRYWTWGWPEGDGGWLVPLPPVACEALKSERLERNPIPGNRSYAASFVDSMWLFSGTSSPTACLLPASWSEDSKLWGQAPHVPCTIKCKLLAQHSDLEPTNLPPRASPRVPTHPGPAALPALSLEGLAQAVPSSWNTFSLGIR